MRPSARILTLAALLSSTVALAQVEVRVGLPRIRFDLQPALVVVAPGVQVVPEYEEEVFYVERHYWVHHSGAWYRSHDHHGKWKVVEHRHVPARLVKMPRGKYRRYKVEHAHHHHDHDRPDAVRHVQHRRDHDRERLFDDRHHDHDRDHGGKHKHKHRGGKHKHHDD